MGAFVLDGATRGSGASGGASGATGGEDGESKEEGQVERPACPYGHFSTGKPREWQCKKCPPGRFGPYVS